ncbi:MAG: hypothetical protein HDQ88_02465, partial [Clostridia bacterium]|nr:hypothetical protein [Clostridia bacterium]
MKMLNKGKAKIIALVILIACVICAVFAYVAINNTDNITAQTEDGTTTIEAPELNIKPSYLVGLTVPYWTGASCTYHMNGSEMIIMHSEVMFTSETLQFGGLMSAWDDKSVYYAYEIVSAPSAFTVSNGSVKLPSAAKPGYYAFRISAVTENMSGAQSSADFSNGSYEVTLDFTIKPMTIDKADMGQTEFTRTYSATASGYEYIPWWVGDEVVGWAQSPLTLSGDTINIPQGAAPGIYQVLLSPNTADYWHWTDGTDGDLVITITITPQYKPEKPDRNRSLTYSPNAQTFSVETAHGKGIDYTLPYGKNWSISGTTVTVPAGTAVGTYTITANLSAGALWYDLAAADGGIQWNDHSSVQIRVTIARATISDITASKTSFTYSTSAQTFTLSSVSYVTVTPPTGWSRSGITITIPANTAVGSNYTVSITPDSNHCWSGNNTNAKTITITIGRATLSDITASKTSFTYSTSSQTFTLSSVSYVSVTPPNGWSRSGTTITIPASTTVGNNYTVSLTPDSNHCWSGGVVTAKTITITIGKATPLASATVSAGTYYIGNTLSTVGISGTASITGTFAWTTPATVISSASAEYSWTFTPLDTTNYNNVTANITVVAIAPLDSLRVEGATTTYKAYEAFTTAGMSVYAVGGGTSKLITTYTITYPYTALGRSYFLASDNGSQVVLSYTESGTTVHYNITVTVEKLDYNISGASMTDKTVTYNASSHSIEMVGTLPAGVRLTGYKYNDRVATSATNAGTYTVSAVFDIDDSANYNMPELSATLKINKATPNVTVTVATGTFYVGENLSGVGIALSDHDVTGSVAWTNSSAVITAEEASYGWTFTPEDTTNYNNVTGLETVSARFKLVSISVKNAKTSYNAFEEFEDSVIIVTATYLAGKNPTQVEDYTFTYPGSTQYFLASDDGKEVTFYYTEGIITVSTTVTVSVGKISYDMTGVDWDYSGAFTYDGTEKTVTVVGKLPDGVSVKAYTDNAKTNADSYTASVTFNYDAVNYNEPTLADLNWVINKANYDMTGVDWDYSGAFTYDGTEKTVLVVGTLPNGVSVKEYTDNAKTNANATGYTASVTFNYDTTNYEEPTLADLVWIINKAKPTLNVDGIETEYVYTGSEQVINSGATVDSDQKIVYANNTFTTVAEGNGLVVEISVAENENWLGETKTVTVTVKTASVGKIEFNGNSVTYDGKTHTLEITGTLPDEVTVEYYLTGLSTKFEGATDVNVSGGVVIGYQVTAKFSCTTGNYEVPADMNATLTITPKTIDASAVSGIDSTYVYNGNTQTPAPTVKLTLTDGGEEIILAIGKDYKVTYSDSNPNAGTHVDVEIEGTGNYQGNVVKSFDITKKTLSVSWIGDKNTYVYNGSAQGISATLEGIVANDLDTVLPTIKYSGRGATEYTDENNKPTDAGYYTVSVSLDETFTNYESFGVQVKNFQIEQAEMVVTVEFDGYNPATDTLYMGGALPNLRVVSATVAGNWSWVSESLSEKATDNYTWQYVPTSEADQRNYKTYTAVISLSAERAPIVRIEAVLNDNAPKFYVTTSFDTIKNYVTVTGYFASPVNGETQTEIKGYSLTSDRFDEYPDTADVYQLTVSYNGLDCNLEVEYFGLEIVSI